MIFQGNWLNTKLAVKWLKWSPFSSKTTVFLITVQIQSIFKRASFHKEGVLLSLQFMIETGKHIPANDTSFEAKPHQFHNRENNKMGRGVL